MKKILGFCLLSALLFSLSCKKKSEEGPNATGTAPLGCVTTAVKQGSVSIYKLAYNSSRNITRMEQRSNTNVLMQTTDYTYSGAKVIKQTLTAYKDDGVTVDGIVYKTFEYDGSGKMTKQSALDEDNTVQNYVIYTYNSSGKLTKDQTFEIVSGSPEPADYRTYEYNSSGSLASITTWSINGTKLAISRYDGKDNLMGVYAIDPDGVTERPAMAFEYDMTKLNALGETLNIVNLAFGPKYSKNALTKIKSFDENGAVSSQVLYQYSDYNAKGYPATVKVTDNAGAVSVLKVEYNCI
jgi:hypothetical protein